MPGQTDLPMNESIFLFDSLPEELYYFAYGPNMNESQIKKRSATAKPEGLLAWDCSSCSD